MTTLQPAAPLLQLSDISKSFGRVHSLRGINLDIRAGEVLGLLGDNGAGKSTLIKILAGVHQPTGGSLKWSGDTISIGSPRNAMARGISVVYQDLGIIPLLSIYRNFFLGREDEVSVKFPGVFVLKKAMMRNIAHGAEPPRHPYRGCRPDGGAPFWRRAAVHSDRTRGAFPVETSHSR